MTRTISTLLALTLAMMACAELPTAVAPIEEQATATAPLADGYARFQLRWEVEVGRNCDVSGVHVVYNPEPYDPVTGLWSEDARVDVWDLPCTGSLSFDAQPGMVLIQAVAADDYGWVVGDTWLDAYDAGDEVAIDTILVGD